jgi:hypothetical protein
MSNAKPGDAPTVFRRCTQSHARAREEHEHQLPPDPTENSAPEAVTNWHLHEF